VASWVLIIIQVAVSVFLPFQGMGYTGSTLDTLPHGFAETMIAFMVVIPVISIAYFGVCYGKSLMHIKLRYDNKPNQ